MPAPPPDSRANLKRSSPWANSTEQLRKLGKMRRPSLTSSQSSLSASRLPSFLSVEKSSSRGGQLHRLHNSSSSSSSGSSYNLIGGSNASFHLSNSNSSFSRCPSSMMGSRRFPSNRTSSGSLSVNSASSGSVNLTSNAVMQMAQRSNGSNVKAVIADLKRICAEAQSNTVDVSSRTPPLDECTMLSLWAVDAYYKVLISKYGGIEAVVTAMKVFPSCADLQTCCCNTLKNIGNKQSVHQEGGVSALAAAMRFHPQSIQVQSEACEALQSQVPMLPEERREVLEELLPLLHHAKEMYLTHTGRSSAVFLLDFVPATIARQQEEMLSRQFQSDGMEVDIAIQQRG